MKGEKEKEDGTPKRGYRACVSRSCYFFLKLTQKNPPSILSLLPSFVRFRSFAHGCPAFIGPIRSQTHCRLRKARCDLGDVNAPSEPPCSRCRREQRSCVFVPSVSEISLIVAACPSCHCKLCFLPVQLLSSALGHLSMILTFAVVEAPAENDDFEAVTADTNPSSRTKTEELVQQEWQPPPETSYHQVRPSFRPFTYPAGKDADRKSAMDTARLPFEPLAIVLQPSFSTPPPHLILTHPAST